MVYALIRATAYDAGSQHTYTHIILPKKTYITHKAMINTLAHMRIRAFRVEQHGYLDARGTSQVGLVIGFMGLIMAHYLGLYGILSGLTESTDHQSSEAKIPGHRKPWASLRRSCSPKAQYGSIMENEIILWIPAVFKLFPQLSHIHIYIYL